MRGSKSESVPVLLAEAGEHIAAGRLAAADAAVSTLEQKGWGGIKTLRMRANVQKRLSQKAEHGETLKRVAEDRNSTPSDLFRWAVHLIETNHLDAARGVMASLRGREDCRHLLLNIDYRDGLHSGNIELVRSALLGLVELDVTPLHLPELRLALRELAPWERNTIADTIREKWPQMAAQVEGIGSIGAQGKTGVQQRAAELATAGQLAESEALLGTGRETDEELRRALRLVPPPEARVRTLIEDNGDNVIVSARGTSDTTLLVFTGLADQAMVPIGCIDAFCAAAGHSAVYLRDRSRSLFVGGVPDLALDYSSSLDAIGRIVEELGTRRLLSFGSSAGGLGAIRYGLDLSASGVLCASGATCAHEAFLDRHADQRGRVVVRRLQRSFGRAELDVYDQVAANCGRTQIVMCYGDGSESDAAHAKHLDGLPGVTLHPLAGLGRHGSFARMVLDGIFAAFIADDLRSTPLVP